MGTNGDRITPILIDEIEAARYLGLSRRTMQAWRVRGDGPPYVKLGAAVRYDLDVLAAWVASGIRHSTADPGPAAVRPRRTGGVG